MSAASVFFTHPLSGGEYKEVLILSRGDSVAPGPDPSDDFNNLFTFHKILVLPFVDILNGILAPANGDQANDRICENSECNMLFPI